MPHDLTSPLRVPARVYRLRRLPLAFAIASASACAWRDEAALKAEIAEPRAQISEMKATD